MKKFLVVLGVLSLTMFTSKAWAQDAGVTDPAATVSPVVDADVVAPVVADPSPAVDVVAPVATVAPTAPVVTEPKTDAEALSMAGELITAAKSGHWVVFAGMLLMVIMYGFRRFGLDKKIPANALPWVTLGVGCVTSFAVAIANGKTLLQGLAMGFLISAAASLLWSTIGKHLLGLLDKKPSPPVTPPVEPTK